LTGCGTAIGPRLADGHVGGLPLAVVIVIENDPLEE
jgi:hypothetical protein